MNSESESAPPSLNIEKCSLILADVAGTTTSIDFVKDTLFPFVINKIETFLTAKWDEETVKECVNLIKEEGKDLDISSAVEKIKTLTQEDSNNKGLKTLQGLIYKEGYEKGDLKAHVFEDVAEAFEAWAKNRSVAIYSTGSVESQKLLFTHTIKGDLSQHIHKYFDQSVGPKTESDSYKAIAKDAEIPAEEIVFLTDDIKEATAAKKAGLTPVLIIREGNPPLSDDANKEFVVISSFKDLELDKTPKRKIGEVTSDEAPPPKIPKTDVAEETEAQPETTEKNGQSEAMEVDPPAEKESENKETEKKSNPEETEKSAESDKTEVEVKEVGGDAEMKEENSTEGKAETTEKKETTADKVKEEKIVEEAKVEEVQKIEKPVEETTAITEEPETTKKEQEVTKVETETKEETAMESKSEEVNKTKETAAEEKTEKTEETTTDKPKTDEIPVKETTEEKTSNEKEEKLKKETPLLETPSTSEEVKPENGAAEVEEEPKSEEGAEEKLTENGESSEKVPEEKENQSVLANGVENGKDESEVGTTAAESSEVQIADDKTDETEVKIKKLDESAESKTVSVEV